MGTTAVKIHRHTDPGAPVLSGTMGALQTIVKTCLIHGRGAGTVQQLQVAAGIATASYQTGHPFAAGSVALFSGAAVTSLNGEQRILTSTATSVTFAAPGVANGVASGAITSKLAAAGWQELFAGASPANVLCLAPGVAEASGCVLYIGDGGSTNARVRAYESMTDATTVTGPTPLDSQCAGGMYWPKSNSSDTSARGWWLISDARGFYLALAPAGADRHTLLYSGDIASYKSGDAYAYLLCGNHTDQTNASEPPDGCLGYSQRSARRGAYLVRAHTAIGQAIAVQRTGAQHNGAASGAYAGSAGYSWGGLPQWREQRADDGAAHAVRPVPARHPARPAAPGAGLRQCFCQRGHCGRHRHAGRAPPAGAAHRAALGQRNGRNGVH